MTKTDMFYAEVKKIIYNTMEGEKYNYKLKDKIYNTLKIFLEEQNIMRNGKKLLTDDIIMCYIGMYLLKEEKTIEEIEKIIYSMYLYGKVSIPSPDALIFRCSRVWKESM